MTDTLPAIDTSGECEVRMMHPEVVERVEAALPDAAAVELATEGLG